MAPSIFTVVLDRTDEFTGARTPLRASARMRTTPEATDAVCVEWLQGALESAVMIGQNRYGILRVEMPSRRSAVEDAARASLDYTLARTGHRLEIFELVSLDISD